jgi:hypothetical protein
MEKVSAMVNRLKTTVFSLLLSAVFVAAASLTAEANDPYQDPPKRPVVIKEKEKGKDNQKGGGDRRPPPRDDKKRDEGKRKPF